MSSGKKRKKGASLLLEPSVEEEQQATLKQQVVVIGSRSSEGFYKNNNKQLGKDDILEAGKQMSASTTSVSTSTKNVITSNSNNNSRHQNKQLTNLLSFLFGSILIIGFASRCVLSAATVPTPTVVTTAANSSIFNQPPVGSSITTTTTASESPPPTTTVTESNETKSHDEEQPNGSETTVPATTTTVHATSAAATTITEKTSSHSPLPETEATSSSEATTSGESLENEDGEEQPVAYGGGSARLTPGLIMDTAGEAADQLLARLRGRGGSSGSDGADADAPEAEQDLPKESGEPAVDRRDIEAAKLTTTAEVEPSPEDTETPEAAELKVAMDTYAKWRAAGDDFIELFSRKMLPVIMEHGYDIDAVTVTGLMQVFNGIRAIKPWALKLLDASAKLSPGILVGTQSDFGDYDECLSVRVDDPSGLQVGVAEIDESTGLPTSSIVGRYCLADVEFPKPPRVRLATRNEELNTSFVPIELRRPLLNFSQTALYKDTIFVETGNFFHMLYVDPLRVGVCLTNKIDPESFSKVVNKLLEEFKVSINFYGRCVTKYDKIQWTLQQKVSACVILVACFLVTLCTLLDVLHSKLNKLPLPGRFSSSKLRLQSSMKSYRPLFTSFSIIRNTKRLFRPQPPPHNRDKHPYASNQHLNGSLTSTSGSYPSSESSPSIERRSSAGDSAMNLISDSASSVATLQPFSSKNANLLGHHFTATTTTTTRQTASERQEANLLCLHGIRVITMTWMIVNHTYLFGGFFVLWAYRRLIDISEWPRSFSFQLVLNGWLTVETYFFLGATIIVLSVMPAMKAKRFGYITYILHRLIRLLPAYTGLICLNFLWPLISSGPVWLVKGKSFIQTPCENYLWTNYLFINNWIWPEKQCMVHTWFLSADFQLYLIAPLIVYLLYRRPTFGHSVNIIVAILASIVSGFVIYANKLMPSTLINKLEFDSIKQQLSYSYFATYQHVGPYCLGIFTGYLLYKRPQVQLPKHLTWALWILLPPLSLTTLFLTYLWNGAYTDDSLINPSPIVSALYVAIHRTIWTSLVAWLVFACATGRAKLLSSFLSHSIFIPLSRLSFSIYLVHLPVIMFRALNLRNTIEWTDTNILWEACGNFIVSLIVGYFVNITFESPITNLEQVIFRRGGSSSNKYKLESGPEGSRNPKLRPQLSVSKTSSENCDSDLDSKSAKSSELAPSPSSQKFAVPPDSDSSVLGVTETASQILDRHMRWPGEKNATIIDRAERQNRRELALMGRTFGHNLRGSGSNYGAEYDEGGDEMIDDLMGTNHFGAPVIMKSPLAGRQSRMQMVAPAVKPIRRFANPTESSLKVDRSSSIYQMAPSEYQQYANSRQTPVALQQGGLFRSSQYATLARTSKFNDMRELKRHEYQRTIYAEGLTATRATRSHLGGEEADSSSGKLNRPALSRRQGRYNTLTGTGTREWRQQIGSRGDDSYPSDSRNTDWAVKPGAMIPRIDSSTLRGASLRANATGNNSIVEEEREEINR